MKKSRQKTRILLLLDNSQRELEYLRLMKKVLQRRLHATTKIIGSVAELQRIYFELNNFKPHVVFVSQIIEKDMRDLAMYIKNSGAVLCVVPSEVTVIPALSDLLVNKKLPYDTYADFIFLPGKRMLDLYKHTDIDKKKIKIVGTPKMSVLIQRNNRHFLSRKKFHHAFSIPQRKNIFLFTSFVTIGHDSLSTDPCFEGAEEKFRENNEFLLASKREYVKAALLLAKDFPKYNVIIKPHPLESGEDYSSITAPNVYVLPDVSFYTCLRSIDLCVHWSSTVATECWIKGITTLQFVPVQKQDAIAEFSGGNPVLHEYAALRNAIRKYGSQPLPTTYLKRQQKFLHDNYYLLDGKAPERIADYVSNELKKNPIHITYRPVFNALVYCLMFLQQMIGVMGSRRLVGWGAPHFKWRYAALNFVDE